MTFTTQGTGDDDVTYYILYADATHYLVMRVYDSNSANGIKVFEEAGAGVNVLIQKGTATSGTSEHYYETTRDACSNFELLEDGASIGTATSLNLPQTVNQRIEFNSSAGGSVINVDEIKHVRF